MRIWDLHPGYLNRQSLLGEHRELHGMVSIFVHNKKGYSRHPETLRWSGYGWALGMRHQLLRCEMALRGYQDRSPVTLADNPDSWPAGYIDPPDRQISILKRKYRDREMGRIPLPERAQQLWAQHKYSLLARDQQLYRKIGPELAAGKITFPELAEQLTQLLRKRPTEGGIRNALQHMWGYLAEPGGGNPEQWSLTELLGQIQHRAILSQQPYLLASTALSELAVWLPED